MNTFTFEPMAIIGMGCRFPGNSNNPKQFWEMLQTGRDGIVEVPKDRWSIKHFYDPNPNKPCKTYTKYGGYLQQPIDEMDSLFFGISPREAKSLDPQQRILLEVAWEALEDAGLVANELKGSDTGVFIGGFMMDHLTGQTNVINRDLLNTHSAVSFSQTLLSARLSYTFDFRGPCLTMDTACSSSLVAMHQACQSMWNGDCKLALVGGVNIMYRAETPITMSKGHFLSADGRCKSFDARADGYGRGEGAGVIVLKPLSEAQRDGDLIYSLVSATGINQDGHTDGITVPSADAQSSLISKVIQQANIQPNQISYIEAHGTGTSIGDPTECKAIGNVLADKIDRPCWIGSVKANIGHLESAAGIASTIKASLCLAHQEIPPVANLETPNPDIPFENLGLRLPVKAEVMPNGHDEIYVGVNSFGYGGTNAHILLQQAPPTLIQVTENKNYHSPYFLPLSARSEKALQATADSYIYYLSNSNEELSNICFSAATRREHHRYRLALVVKSIDDIQQQLKVFAEGKGQHLLTGKTPAEQQKVVFVMTGMGPQWWAMGCELLQSEPVFREMVERCDAVFKSLSGWSIIEEMTKNEKESRIAETLVAQPANFVLQVGLFELWKAKGITPAAIVGHSVGEVSAAYVSGVLSLEDALTVCYHRSRLQASVSGRGKMLAVGLSQVDAQELLDQYGKGKVSFGAINSSASVTLSGDGDILDKISKYLDQQDIFNRFLRVELAYHSPVMEELRVEIMSSLANIKPSLPKIPLYSTVTGKLVDTVLYDAAYWYDNIREPVYFAEAIKQLAVDNYSLFVEVGPHPVLATAIKEMLASVQKRGNVVTTLKRKEPEQSTFYNSLGGLFCLGCTPNWEKYYPEGGQYVRLPTYPWQRESYWNETEEALYDRCGDDNDHPLLGHFLSTPTATWEQSLNDQFLPWLPEHQVQGLVVLPGAAYVEIGLQLHQLLNKSSSCVIEDIRFQRALVINDLDEPVLQSQYDEEQRCYRIYSRNHGEKQWIQVAQGQLSTMAAVSMEKLDLDFLTTQCSESLAVDVLYARLAKRGLHYGKVFRGIQQAWRGDNQALVKIQAQTSVAGFNLHPTVLDASFQSLIGILEAEEENSFIPISISKIEFFETPKQNVWAYSRLKFRDNQQIIADLYLCDEQGNVQVSISDLCCQALASNRQQSRNIDDWFYQVYWQQQELSHEQAPLTGGWLLFMDKEGVAESLVKKMNQAQVERIVKVTSGDCFNQLDQNNFVIRSQNQQDMLRLVKQANVKNMQGVLFSWGLDIDEMQDPDGTLMSTTWLYCAQACMSVYDNQNRLRLFLLTCGAQNLASENVSITQASLVGLGRVIANEYGLRGSLLDMENTSEQVMDLVSQELLANDLEQEIAFYSNKRFVYRLKNWQSESEDIDNSLMLSGRDAFSLQDGKQGFYWQQSEQVSLAQGDIELIIDYIVLPRGYKPGQDALVPVSGVVVRSQSKDFSKSQKVMGFVPINTLSNHFCVSADRVILINAVKSPVLKRTWNKIANSKDAIPEAVKHLASLDDFASALYGLEQVIRLQTGESILIHASDDNSDLAAVQIALAEGANVVATYRSEQKREAIQALGVKACFSCESMDFLSLIEKEKPAGFDVIINTLTGEASEKTIRLLKPFGRILMNTKTTEAFSALAENIHQLRLDMASVRINQPLLYQKLLKHVVRSFAKGKYSPFSINLFDAPHVKQALKLVQQENVALRLGEAEKVPVQAQKNNKLNLKQGSYLITGGFGGFGLKIAEWLSKNDIKHIVLVGRRGAVSREAKETIALLHDAGVTVMEAAVDISEEKQVKDLIAKIADEFPPLIGVFHTAAVLDDAMLNDLTAERLTAVMRPKALGAWYLHQYTKALELDYFVLFSSISALVGKPGQSNYVTANTFLDQLAKYRKAKELPAISLNWGVLAEVGMSAQQGVEERLSRMGIESFTPDEAMHMLERSLAAEDSQLGLMHMNWKAFCETNSNVGVTLRFEHLLDKDWLSDENPLQQFYDELNNRDLEQRLEYMSELITGWAARIMRLPVDSVDGDTSLNDYGLDSLVAVEFQGIIESQTGVILSVLDVMQKNSIDQLADKILARLDV